jgi:hypothetical protein
MIEALSLLGWFNRLSSHAAQAIKDKTKASGASVCKNSNVIC